MAASVFDRDSYLRALVRAGAGGLLFGMPLLYTMEVWWSGFVLPWWKVLLVLGIGAFFVSAFTRIEGFRRDRTLGEVAEDAAVSFGIGIAIATVMLVVLGQLDSGSSLREWVGMIALETVPVAIGASVARALLGERGGGGDGSSIEPGAWGQAIVAAGGALFFALNVAPTDEPVLIGIGNRWWLNVVLLAATIPVTFGIVFYADFRGSHRRRREKGSVSPTLTPAGETMISLAAAFAVSALLLWLFGRLGSGTGFATAVDQIISLGFVAAIGAAAARLLL
jgi:putative integral membrane protein (TIGR02587 family)